MHTFSSWIYVFVNILFFTSWATNLSCTICRTYTLVCDRPNLWSVWNNQLLPVHQIRSSWHAFPVEIFWTERKAGIHCSCNWQTDENEIESVLFYPDFFSFSRLISTWYILNFREYWRHFSVHLSLIDFCFQFTFGFHSALHLTYSFHIRQIFFCFVLPSLQSLL